MPVLIKYNGLGGKLKFSGASTGGFKAKYLSSAAPLLLDAYPGAAAAYSLRKLRNAYTGNAIRLARSSDSAQIDIGFVNNTLDTAALLNFCGSGVDGFVATWYDQSGNGNNLVQSDKASMPLIVSVGALILLNSKQTLLLSAGPTMSTSTSFFNSTQTTILAVSKQTTTTNFYKRLVSIGAYNSGYYLGSSPNVDDMLAIFNNTTFTCVGGVALAQNISIAYNNATTGFLVNNGSQVSSITTTVASYGNQALYLGTDSVGAGQEKWNGNVQEVIVYPTNQSTNIAGINSNINSYYSIY
jgi:hypothetical protein